MKNKLTLKTPAGWWGAKWREALPCGNGKIGAAVYGAVHDETVLLTHEDLWHGVVTEELPDVSGELPRIRELLADGKAKLAEPVMADAIQATGYQPEIGTPLPLADLKVKMPVQKGFRNYRRSLDMETGEAFVTWDDDGVSYQRKSFVSRTDDLVVMEIQANQSSLDFEVTLALHYEVEPNHLYEKALHIPDKVEVKHDGASGLIRYAARNDDGTDFGAVARVVAISESKDSSVIARPNSIHVEGTGRALIVVKLFVRGQRESACAELAGELDDVVMDYDTMLAPHAKEHGELFSRVQIDLDGRDDDHAMCNEELLLDAYQGEASQAFVEKMWAFGRYLLVSSSRDGGQPCHLLGNWCGEYRGFWAFNMANENLQMIYWQAFSGQLAEVTLSVFDYYDRMMDDFRDNAKKLYGCRGVFIPAVTTPPSGLLKTVRPHIIHWTGAGAWIGQLYYDYYLYTGDRAFLKDRVLPFLREVALFYEDFFTINDDGFYVSSPSNSPENSPGNYYDGKGMGMAMETTINATMDFALAKEVLTHLIEGANEIGGCDEEVEKWEAMRERIPPYEINEDGAVKEWMHPLFTDNYHHRHQSHIYPVFPGIEVTHESDPGLFEAFKVAIDRRHVIGLGEQTGWSLAHMSSVYARLGDGDSAVECLNLLARSCVKNNFFTTHNDWRGMGVGLEMEWAPFQIDANMGWSAAIQEILLFSFPGKISVLPALPTQWKRGSATGLMARGGVRVGIRWDEQGASVELLSPVRQTVELTLFRSEKQTVELEPDEPLAVWKQWNRHPTASAT